MSGNVAALDRVDLYAEIVQYRVNDTEEWTQSLETAIAIPESNRSFISRPRQRFRALEKEIPTCQYWLWSIVKRSLY